MPHLFKVLAAILLTATMHGQNRAKLVKRISRYHNVKKEDVELIHVFGREERMSRREIIRRLNTDIGMPSGFGRGPIQIPSGYKTVYYVKYRTPIGTYYGKYDRYLRRKKI